MDVDMAYITVTKTAANQLHFAPTFSLIFDFFGKLKSRYAQFFIKLNFHVERWVGTKTPDACVPKMLSIDNDVISR